MYLQNKFYFCLGKSPKLLQNCLPSYWSFLVCFLWILESFHKPSWKIILKTSCCHFYQKCLEFMKWYVILGQGGLACCGSWGRKESDMTKQLNWIECRHLMCSYFLVFLSRNTVYHYVYSDIIWPSTYFLIFSIKGSHIFHF